MIDRPRWDVGGNQDRWHTHAEPSEIEGRIQGNSIINPFLVVRIYRRRRRYVVVQPAMLIVHNGEQSRVPNLGVIPDSFEDDLDECFPFVDIVIRVLVTGGISRLLISTRGIGKARLDKAISRKVIVIASGQEIIEGAEEVVSL